jgi:dethiobiotin synthetase
VTVVAVLGTGTDVGKTWVLARLVTELRRRGRDITVRKPAQSFAPADVGATDADVLADAAGCGPTDVCPAHRWYETPMAPPMAAEVLGRPGFSVADLAAEVVADGLVLVEGAGGPRSPLARDGDNVDLARALRAQLVVLVADAGLGAINAVRLCGDALSGFDLVVVLNRFDPVDDLHQRNRSWLAGAGYCVVTDPGALADALGRRLEGS